MNDVSPLNKALAENLAHHMQQQGLKQMALAKKCGVAQTTISLYLSPERRKPGKDAKPGSAKLTEVEMLADALGVPAWELLWPLDASQRAVYAQIAEQYKALQKSNVPAQGIEANAESVKPNSRIKKVSSKAH